MKPNTVWHGSGPFCAVGGALTYPSLNNGFATDDHFMRALYQDFPGLDPLRRGPLETFAFSKGNVEENEWLRDKGVFPWWAGTNAKLSFFRPFASATHWFDYTTWSDSAWKMHLQNIFWFALMCGLAFVLYREISKPAWIAWLAAFMYAADEIHGQAVGWISSRNTLMVTCASICVLIAHHRWRTTKRDRWAIAAFAMYGTGLLCGEGAIAVCSYLFAYALVMGYDTWRGRVMSLVPYAAISGVYLVLYRVYGFGSAGSGGTRTPARTFRVGCGCSRRMDRSFFHGDLHLAHAALSRGVALERNLFWADARNNFGCPWCDAPHAAVARARGSGFWAPSSPSFQSVPLLCRRACSRSPQLA